MLNLGPIGAKLAAASTVRLNPLTPVKAASGAYTISFMALPPTPPGGKTFLCLEDADNRLDITGGYNAGKLPALLELVRAHGLNRSAEDVRRAFAVEGRYYVERCAQGRDEASVAALRRDCVGVFLAELDADLDAAALAESYVETFSFELLPGTLDTLWFLRGRGLALAIVSNWDVSLHTRIAELGIAPLVDVVVSSGDAGASKPDPAIFVHALERLGVPPARAVHVGDSTADVEGAAVAGMHFAPVPLQTAFAPWR